jgi:hypothetical protein
MPKILAGAALAAAFATPALAATAPADPPLALVQADQRLSLILVFGHAHPLVKLVLLALAATALGSLVLWIVRLADQRGRRSDGAVAAIASLSCAAAAAPLLGFFGAAYGLMDSFIGVANVRPVPSLSVLAPGLAEAFLSLGLGLLAAAIATIGRHHLKARLDAADALAASAAPAPRANTLSRAIA